MSEILYGCIQPTIYANIPLFIDLFMDAEPELRYQRLELPRGRTLYYACEWPLFNSFVHAPGSKDGFAGRSFTLKMLDGSEWHSPAGELWASGEGYAAWVLDINEFMGCAYRYPNAFGHEEKGGLAPWNLTGFHSEIDFEFIQPFLEPGWEELGMGPYKARSPEEETKPWLDGVSAEQARVIES